MASGYCVRCLDRKADTPAGIWCAQCRANIVYNEGEAHVAFIEAFMQGLEDLERRKHEASDEGTEEEI